MVEVIFPADIVPVRQYSTLKIEHKQPNDHTCTASCGPGAMAETQSDLRCTRWRNFPVNRHRFERGSHFVRAFSI